MLKPFKIGEITPLFKNQSKQQSDSYLPITVLSIPSKVLQRFMHSKLMNQLESHKLLSQNQFDFRRK